MGQSIVVNEKPSSNRGVVRFETNRAITGMGHERYLAGTEVWGHRPPDELARRILAHGGVLGVQINGNIVTVDLARGHTSEGLKSIIENLYRFYPDGPAAAEEPVAVEEQVAAEEPAPPADDPAPVVDPAPSAASPEGEAAAQVTTPATAPADPEAAAAGPGADPA